MKSGNFLAKYLHISLQFLHFLQDIDHTMALIYYIKNRCTIMIKEILKSL
jgi:hypothetical protein